MGLEPEDEADVARGVPAIQMLGLSEFGVSPQQDLAEASLKAKRDSLVQEDVGQLLRGAVAAAIEQEQWFGGIGQRDQERMVAVLAVVGEVHPLLALGIARHDGAIGVQNRFLEELGGLLGPDPQAGLIDGVHQGHDIGLSEAAAEVAGSGGIGDALGSQGVEIDFVVAPQFEVFDPVTASEDVEGDVQDVVGFVIGKMHLEQMKIVVDLADQADPVCQEKHGADAAGAEPLDAIGQFVMDIGRGHHGYGPLGPRQIDESLLNSSSPFLEILLLRASRFFRTVALTRKPPCLGIVRMCSPLHYSKNTGGFRVPARLKGRLPSGRQLAAVVREAFPSRT